MTIEARGGDVAVPATGGPVRVTVDPARGRTIPPIGLGVASHGTPLSDEDVALLRALRPAHLHFALDVTESGWQESLARAKQEAGALGAALAIEAIAGPVARDCRTSPLLWRDQRSTSPGCWSLPPGRWSPTRRSSSRRAKHSRKLV